MSRLLEQPPFAPRDDAAFLAELNELTAWHLEGCAEYRRVWPDCRSVGRAEDAPYLHAGLFKHILFKTRGRGIEHQRTLTSSSTSGADPSKIVLDRRSSDLQAQSSLAILKDLVGGARRPLIVLDSACALRKRGEVAARVAAAMSLRPLAAEIHFVSEEKPEQNVNWSLVRDVFQKHDDVLVYGFTWILWKSWASAAIPADVAAAMSGKRIHFVHSGGWKKLNLVKVDRACFDAALLRGLAADSKVIDYYGLVEQVGVIYPLCEHGCRHAPRWSQVIVRNPWTLEAVAGEEGLLQLMNVLAWGAPYHSVLTEDLGRLVPGACACGRAGTRFELLGRAERGSARMRQCIIDCTTSPRPTAAGRLPCLFSSTSSSLVGRHCSRRWSAAFRKSFRATSGPT